MPCLGSIIFFSLYGLAVFFAGASELISKPVPDQTFAVWFWDELDWNSFRASAIAGLFGAFIRTLKSFRTLKFESRLFLTLFGDALMGLGAGFLVFLIVSAYHAYWARLPHIIVFLLGVGAGYIRGGLFNAFETIIKTVLATSTDGLLRWVAKTSGAAVEARTPTIPNPALRVERRKRPRPPPQIGEPPAFLGDGGDGGYVDVVGHNVHHEERDGG